MEVDDLKYYELEKIINNIVDDLDYGVEDFEPYFGDDYLDDMD